MNKSIAKHVIDLSTECFQDINESIRGVMEQCDDETFKAYRRSMGRIMGHLMHEIVDTTHSLYPDLAPPDFKAMEMIAPQKLVMTREMRDQIDTLLGQLYERIQEIATIVDNGDDDAEAWFYRSKVNEVLARVAIAKHSLLAGFVEKGAAAV